MITLKLTDQEIEFIKNSLKRSLDRGESEERLALEQGRTDAASFYCDLSAKARSLLLVIDSQTAKESDDDEDVCSECSTTRSITLTPTARTARGWAGCGRRPRRPSGRFET